jgi:hypothetical protein
MSEKSTTELAVFEALSYTPPTTTLAPGPGGSTSEAKSALRRCCAAWQRSFKAYMEGDDATGGPLDATFAAKDANKAYCNAMPVLAGYEGVRDFVACAAHGLLTGAISPEKGGQLLYAAQVALNTCQYLQELPESQGHPPTPLKKPHNSEPVVNLTIVE